MKGLRKWPWSELPDYNGFTHVERVRGWQLIMWLEDSGLFKRGATCCISGQTHQLRLHSENYYSWEPFTLNHSIHMALHQRFNKPDAWLRIVERYSSTGEEWFAKLALLPVDLAGELRSQNGQEYADIFARFEACNGLKVPRNQIYRINKLDMMGNEG
ncbi:hypothetical protein U2P60_04080 [Brucella sp. H1_1004]|uniref:hypothetical protein n=1 Tax=Brucella sp. H1_1004 TaxID=3110109 RepID=UPI0039B601CD